MGIFLSTYDNLSVSYLHVPPSIILGNSPPRKTSSTVDFLYSIQFQISLRHERTNEIRKVTYKYLIDGTLPVVLFKGFNSLVYQHQGLKCLEYRMFLNH